MAHSMHKKTQDKNGRLCVSSCIELANVHAGLFPCPVLLCPLLIPSAQPSPWQGCSAAMGQHSQPAALRKPKACQPFQDKLLRL